MLWKESEVKNVRKRIKAALIPLGRELGVKFVVGAASFMPFTITYQLKGHVTGRGNRDNKSIADDFKFYAVNYDLVPSDYHRELLLGEQLYRIVGLKPTALKRPIIAERQNGDKSMFSVEMVKRGFKLKQDREVNLIINMEDEEL